jgi:hypothetical protein
VEENPGSPDIRHERREKRLKKKREQMQQHGNGLAKIYRNVIFKRSDLEKK